jgi:hypothetical protein
MAFRQTIKNKKTKNKKDQKKSKTKKNKSIKDQKQKKTKTKNLRNKSNHFSKKIVGGESYTKVQNFDPNDRRTYYYTTVNDSEDGTVKYEPIGTFSRHQLLAKGVSIHQYYFTDAVKPLVIDTLYGVNDLESKLYVKND